MCTHIAIDVPTYKSTKSSQHLALGNFRCQSVFSKDAIFLLQSHVFVLPNLKWHKTEFCAADAVDN